MNPATPNIEDLTRRMKRGQQAAYQEFYDAYALPILRYLAALHQGDIESAKDTLQATFIRIAKHIRVFRDQDVFWNWIRRVARTAFLDSHRQQSRYRRLLHRYSNQTPPASDPDSHETQLLNAIKSALNALSPEARELVEAYYFQRLTHAEIARKHQLTPRAIEGRLARIRVHLRALITRAQNER